jgi:hypothetical protein
MPPTPSPLHRTTYVYKQCGGTSIEADVIGAAPGAPRPCIVWIHGGGLMFGWRKSSPRASLIEALIERGFVIVSIDHRLAPETRLPEIVEDVRDAWSRVHAFGASHLGVDPTRIAVAGASSSQAHRRRRRIVVAGASPSQAHRRERISRCWLAIRDPGPRGNGHGRSARGIRAACRAIRGDRRSPSLHFAELYRTRVRACVGGRDPEDRRGGRRLSRRSACVTPAGCTRGRRCAAPSAQGRAMKQTRIVVTRYGGPEQLHAIEEDLPSPGRVKCA